MRRSVALALGSALLAAVYAFAQSDETAVYVPQTGYGGYGMPYGYGHASTVQEGMARGVADMVQAAGQANLMNSAAAINYETARSKDLDNRLKYAETYFAKRRMYADYKADKKKPPLTSEQLFRMNQGAKPKRLGPNDFDPVTGQIRWPSLLSEDTFADDRQTLESIFEKAVKYKRLSSDDYAEVQQIGERMRKQLVDRIKEVPPRDQIRANSFLTSLLYEARLASG